MLRPADVRIRPKLFIVLLFTGIIPLGLVGFLSNQLAMDALIEKSFNQLLTVQGIRKSQLNQTFRERVDDVRNLAENQAVLTLFRQLNALQPVNDSTPTARYTADISFYGKNLKSKISKYGYYDLFLIRAPYGQVMFTVSAEEDMGANLEHGDLRDSGLGQIWRKVYETGKTSFVDFSPYGPSGGKQAAFVGHPLRNDDGVIEGVVALQLTPKFVTDLMDSTQGMGETGESYLIRWFRGTDRAEFRSNMKTMGGGKYVVGYSLKTLEYWRDAIQAGAQGGHGTYVDSAGNNVLVAYDELTVLDMKWYLISKIDQWEVTGPVRTIIFRTLLAAIVLVVVVTFTAIILSRSITKPLFADMKFAQEISDGKLDATLDLDRRDELGELADTLNTMAKSLREQDWMTTGRQQLDDVMRGKHEVDALAKDFITYFVKHLGAQLGAFYFKHEEGPLFLQASYAFSDRGGIFNRINLGEGMIGQAGLEGEVLFYLDVPEEEAPKYNYGAGERVPGYFMAAPLHYEDALLGVFLIGANTPFTDLQKKFVRENLENTAILFNTVKSRQMIADLLGQSQKQQEKLQSANLELESQTEALKKSEAELQSQQEELRVMNEELEEQTKALKESEAELQAQQEELRVSNEELEEYTQTLEKQKSAIRTKNADLLKAQNDIKQKAKDLEIASKYKSEFLANMSHELRTPLNSILILSQLLAKNKTDNLTEKQVESAKAINSSGTDLLTLINEILDLSKVEAGKIDLIIENLQVEGIVSDLKRLYTEIAKEQQVAFEITVAEDIPETIRSDGHRIQQVVRNLLTNAFKFTASQTGRVELLIARPRPDMMDDLELKLEEAVAFTVKDNGIGIPRDKQAAIFEAFQQADGSTSRKYGGTGLGLSISRELAKLLGGKITLESAEGEGSAFTMIVPEQTSLPKPKPGADVPPVQHVPRKMAKPKPAAPPKALDPDSPPDGALAQSPPATLKAPEQGEEKLVCEETPPDEELVKDDRKGLKPGDKSILIVEDDQKFAKVMRDFAHERGFKSLIAEDGETGLHFADYYKPSAIVLDIGLPGIDGWTVMERLKGNPDLRHIPVHFMSAADSSMDAMRMGAVGFLTKPVSMEDVDKAFGKLEGVIAKPVREVLVVEDDTLQRESIKDLISDSDVKVVTAATGEEALDHFSNGAFDCMILDLGLEDMSDFELLEKIRQAESYSHIPIIIYTGRELTQEEDMELQRYAESIIIKGARSPERLLDETALFLHRVEQEMPADKRKMLKMVHDKESVLVDKNILLVDDDMRNVFALSGALEEKDMNIIVARDGLESLDKLKEHPEVDLVLMDIMMPNMDGYEAMQEIRKIPQHKNLPIIALTAKAMKGDRTKCIEAGANDYLAKPVNTDKLISMLRVWLYS